ncbi:hypothetical protein GV729_13920, partial [Pseudomonas sp. Fl4BN2]|nr:hypothetical protein [Pseudomonas sp. Fl4BN2]
MRNLDFSSWEAILSTLAGLVLITVIGVGIRLLAMHTIQQRRERENRQINERLRTLIAAYKTLGGSFTGNLEVDPTHLRDLRRRTATANTSPDQAAESVTLTQAVAVQGNGDRSRRVRDAVEAALSDIILLGTEEQVRMAAVAATELVAGRPIHTAELVTSLRDFIRAVLDLDPVPAELSIPKQGPVRPSSSGGGKGDKGDSRSAGKGGGAGGDGAG